jgi:hypothetical protein
MTGQAWVWSNYFGEVPQCAVEQTGPASSPLQTAWIWSEYLGELPQSDAEHAALIGRPAPMAWVWSQYRAAGPLREETEGLASSPLLHQDSGTVPANKAPAFPFILAASIVVVSVGLVWLFQ